MQPGKKQFPRIYAVLTLLNLIGVVIYLLPKSNIESVVEVTSETSLTPENELEAISHSTFTCNKNQIRLQDAEIKRYGKKPALGCADPVSLLPYLHAIWSRTKNDLVFMNVGANKGEFSVCVYFESMDV